VDRQSLGLRPGDGSGERLERGHGDGWGLVLFRNGVLLESVHEARSAAKDPEYARVARKVVCASAAVAPGKASVVLGHVRRKSSGMPAGRGFSHPFVEIRNGKAWAFAHNGGLEGYTFTEEEGLIDSQVHNTFGDYTPRQKTVGFLESYVHGGVTSATTGETRYPVRVR